MTRTPVSPKRLAAVTAIAAAVLVGGLATAGALPGAAQQAAADALDTVGITVPNPNEASNGHADVRGSSEQHTTTSVPSSTTPTSAAPGTTPTSTGNGQGAEISQLARTTDATGVDKGAEISNQASNGQSHAGEDHPGAGGPPPVPASTPSKADSGLSHHP